MYDRNAMEIGLGVAKLKDNIINLIWLFKLCQIHIP